MVSIIGLTVWCPVIGSGVAGGLGGILGHASSSTFVPIISDVVTLGGVFGLAYKTTSLNVMAIQLTQKIEHLSKLWVIVSRISANLRLMDGNSKKLLFDLNDIANLWIGQNTDIARGLLGHDITEDQIDALLGFEKGFCKMDAKMDDDNKESFENFENFQGLQLLFNANNLNRNSIYRQNNDNINNIKDNHIRRQYRNQLKNLKVKIDEIKQKFKYHKAEIETLQRDEIARTKGKYLKNSTQEQDIVNT